MNRAARIRLTRLLSLTVWTATMTDRQITKESQAGTLRGWMLGLHATHIIDIGGRLGYFAELKRRGGVASAQELATALKLDPWRTEVWCRAACAVSVLGYED